MDSPACQCTRSLSLWMDLGARIRQLCACTWAFDLCPIVFYSLLTGWHRTTSISMPSRSDGRKLEMLTYVCKLAQSNMVKTPHNNLPLDTGIVIFVEDPSEPLQQCCCGIIWPQVAIGTFADPAINTSMEAEEETSGIQRLHGVRLILRAIRHTFFSILSFGLSRVGGHTIPPAHSGLPGTVKGFIVSGVSSQHGKHLGCKSWPPAPTHLTRFPFYRLARTLT